MELRSKLMYYSIENRDPKQFFLTDGYRLARDGVDCPFYPSENITSKWRKVRRVSILNQDLRDEVSFSWNVYIYN